METTAAHNIIQQTKAWIQQVVIGCNFCPFAGKAFVDNKIHYALVAASDIKGQLESVLLELQRLDEREDLETTLLIFPTQLTDFEQYLDFVSLSEGLVAAHDYEGIYQVASFHPDYIFSGSDETDPANYTNRSPYPMLHLLRENSVSRAVDLYPDVDSIPDNNVNFARDKGLEGMREMLRKVRLFSY
jgi:uncharacterized protein